MEQGYIDNLIKYLKLLPINEWVSLSKIKGEEKDYLLNNILPFQNGKRGYMFETNGISTDKESITKIRRYCLCNSGRCDRCGAKWMSKKHLTL